MAKLLKISA